MEGLLLLLPHAIALTAADNEAYLADSADPSPQNNWTCRLEIPVLVQQPEVDTRITVKGEDTAPTSSECLNLELGPDEQLVGEIWLEWLNPATGRFEVIRETNEPGSKEYRKPCELSSLKGVGVLPCWIDVVFPATHYAVCLGAIHRAGAILYEPVPKPAAYSMPVYWARAEVDV